MRQLPRFAQLYLCLCYAAGLASLVWLADDVGSLRLEDGLLALALAALAAAAQVFVVARQKTHYSDHLTPAPMFAAVLLLPSPLLALVVILTFIPEWIKFRRPWFIQTFNIATWLASVSLSTYTLEYLTGHERLVADVTLSATAIMAAMVVFLATQTVSLALVLRLARNKPFRDSGLFAPVKLFSETALMCSGWAFAAAWTVDPAYAVPAGLPLLIIFQALHVPNLKEEAATDPKTGLLNVRHFNLALQREFERAERTDQPFSLLMCDLDYLRNINNTYGHQAGDVVLVGVADVIRSAIRQTDIAARFGGEEFVVLLPEADSATARQVAERIRDDFAQQSFDIGEGHALVGGTVSIGIATYPNDGRLVDALVREADLALYQAKREGRNRVVVASRASRELVGEWARENLVAPSGAAASSVVLPSQRANPAVRASSAPDLSASPRHMTGDAPPQSAASERCADRDAGALSSPLLLMIGATSTLGLLAQVPGLLTRHPLGDASWIGLALFVGLVILAEQQAIDIDGRGKTSVAVVAILGASLLYGEPGSIVAATAFAVWAKVRAHSPFHRLAFNLGNALLAATGALWLFRVLTDGPFGHDSFEQLLIPAALAGLAYYAVNHVLLCMVRGLAEDRRPWEIWHADYRWLWPHYTVLGVLALLLGVGYVEWGWPGLLALIAPVAMMHLVIKQYMDRMAVHVNELRRFNGRLTDSYEATLQALTRALDTRDEETEEHSQRVKRYTELIGRYYGLSDEEVEHIARGALLHDIGKIGVPDAILLKPGDLTDEERALMQRHPTIGFTMIAHIPFLSRAAEVVLHHHEAYDGTGYPSAIAGESIPVGARIFAVVDALDAMTSDRPYRRAMSFPRAIEEIRRCSGTQFDPSVVDALLKIDVRELRACARGNAEPVPAGELFIRDAGERVAV